MNTETGAIAQFETEEDAQDAGFNLKLTDAQAKELTGLSRQQRREWARNNANDAARKIERLERENSELRAQLLDALASFGRLDRETTELRNHLAILEGK